MNKLRNLGIAMLTVVVLLSVAGVIFAFTEVWAVSISLLFGAVVMSVVTALFTTRYVSRNARTGEQGTKVVVQKHSARLNKAMKQQSEAIAELRSVLESLRSAQDDTVAMIRTIQRELSRTSQELSQTFQTELKSSKNELDSSITNVGKDATEHAKTTKRHVTSTVRDSTRQIESLIPMYQRYSDTKLPMPNSGGWAIDSQALAHMLALIEERQPQRILELGSGTSTIWIGYLCRTFGGKLVTLDHLEHYLGLTRTAIERHQLNDVIESRLAPLETIDVNGKSFEWYSIERLQDLENIDMVIIDGPPASTGPQARYPALPEVVDALSPNATIILDDAHRDDEAKIVESWLNDYPDFGEIEHGTSRLAVLQRSTEGS